jgi:hypothetical protein
LDAGRRYRLALEKALAGSRLHAVEGRAPVPRAAATLGWERYLPPDL